jgi:hypothetical protein
LSRCSAATSPVRFPSLPSHTLSVNGVGKPTRRRAWPRHKTDGRHAARLGEPRQPGIEAYSTSMLSQLGETDAPRMEIYRRTMA